jgi:hypothetical protein
MGRHAVGRCPYGYLSADKTDSRGTLRIDPERAPVVKRIFTLARDGDGPSRIARRLNHEGVPGPTGKGWNRQTVTNLVRNTVYAGEMHSVRGAQPAIVSRRLWNAAQRGRDWETPVCAIEHPPWSKTAPRGFLALVSAARRLPLPNCRLSSARCGLSIVRLKKG